MVSRSFQRKSLSLGSGFHIEEVSSHSVTKLLHSSKNLNKRGHSLPSLSAETQNPSHLFDSSKVSPSQNSFYKGIKDFSYFEKKVKYD